MSNIINNQLYLLYGVQYKGGVIFFFWPVICETYWVSLKDEWLISSVYVYVDLIFLILLYGDGSFFIELFFFVWEKIKDVPNGTWYLAVNTCSFYFSDKNTFTRPSKCYIFWGSSNISFHWCFWWDVTRFMNFGSRTFSCR